MNLLFVASECAPFIKTGGLADVIGAVPKALDRLGAKVRIMLPGYPALAGLLETGETMREFSDLFGGPARLIAARSDGLDVMLLEAPHLYDRAGSIYLDGSGRDWTDNHLRFGALSRVAAAVGAEGIGDWRPDLVNAHDWQAGLVPAYLRQAGSPRPPVVMTIHNIAFQGLFPPRIMAELGLSADLFSPDIGEFWGQFGFLKTGLALADRITTVSPTYARELMTPEYGMGLEGLLRARQGDLTGILNGIDTDIWNPETDTALPATYTARNLRRKAGNRAALAERFGLLSGDDGPIFCVISRLTEQKGLDLLLDVMPVLIGQGGRLALLGTGNPELERAFAAAAVRHSGSVGTVIGYDEDLAHLMQGGADAILIPSRFEPCGLTQLYGLRYGTIPVVARTGGLADTVIDANAAALSVNCATGIQFSPVTRDALEAAILRTCELYRDRKSWEAVVRRAMRHEVSWDASAASYLALFEDVIATAGGA